MLMETMCATTRWMSVEDTTLVRAYYLRHSEDEFLVRVDKGYGTGIETCVMSGKHIHGCLVYKLRSKVYATARIYPYLERGTT